jgi:DNA-binding MurR/RpiR family transcriptional regulator
MTLKLANLKPEDLVVAFSHSGETPEVVNAFRLARKAGAHCLAITHNLQSPLIELANTWLITCGSAGPFQGDSIATRLSQLFIIEFLVPKSPGIICATVLQPGFPSKSC